ncbi:MAG: NAD-binding protein [Sulfurovaceae bacterium]|nr:NAD-binding protein [Sulfurovaceae bacterium]
MKNSSLWLLLQKMRVPFIVIVVTYTIAIAGLISLDGIEVDGEIYRMTIFDAFYFVTYTATTIGFGEVPYTFSYPQRMWVSALIYITVIGWFYGIGSLLSILQDKLFISEIKKTSFRKKVRKIREDFFIILGYNNVTKKIVGKMLAQGYRVVVIEKNPDRANELVLENYVPSVPILEADIYDPKALELAGIKSKYCKGLVSLFENDNLNLKIAITAKILNSKIPLAIKSTTKHMTENLEDLGVEIIENPFEIISQQIQMLLTAPSLYKLVRWMHGRGDLRTTAFHLPEGKYIICGYGRMGHEIKNVLEKNNIEAVFIEMDATKKNTFSKKEQGEILFKDADDKDVLLQAGTEDAVAIIAGSKDDTTNLSLLSIARKINPNIVTIARENEIENQALFNYANINYVFMPSRLLIYKTIAALIDPIVDKFIAHATKQDEMWAKELLGILKAKVGDNPTIYKLFVDDQHALALTERIKRKESIKLETLTRSRANRDVFNPVVALLLLRKDELYLLPDMSEIILEYGDQILFASHRDAIEDIEYIAENIHELAYVLGEQN